MFEMSNFCHYSKVYKCKRDQTSTKPTITLTVQLHKYIVRKPQLLFPEVGVIFFYHALKMNLFGCLAVFPSH